MRNVCEIYKDDKSAGDRSMFCQNLVYFGVLTFENYWLIGTSLKNGQGNFVEHGQ